MTALAMCRIWLLKGKEVQYWEGSKICIVGTPGLLRIQCTRAIRTLRREGGMSRKRLAEIIVAYIIIIAVVLLVATLTPSPSETMFPVPPMVAAGGSRTVGLKSDGSVVAVGSNDYE